MSRPACLITGILSDYRREPFRLLAAAEDVEVITWRDPGRPVEGLTVRHGSQRDAVRLVASNRYRAVICGLGGRVALPGSYVAARSRRIPFVLWATMWSHPRTAAHALSYLPTLHLYRHADAVLTYGPHVSTYVRKHRSDGNVFEAPQAVDVRHFAQPVSEPARAAIRRSLEVPDGGLLVLYVGRLAREKGIEILLRAWKLAALGRNAVLAVAGQGPLRPLVERERSVTALGVVPPPELPALYAAADGLVLPSIRTATFTEPWGLVANEAMLQRTPVVASDAVGAVAGGLVRHGRNGLVVRAGDPASLAEALTKLAQHEDLRLRLGRSAYADAARYTPEAWLAGARRALAAVGANRAGTSADRAVPT